MSATHTPTDAVEKELEQKNISIVHLLDGLIEKAHRAHASDIHVNPEAHHIRIRLRVDGVLQDAYTFPKVIHSEIISRIKVLSRLRSDEHQATQDGRFRHSFENSPKSLELKDLQTRSVCKFVDIRVSIAPTYHGENAVLRLLSEEADVFSLASMGFSESDCQKIEHALKKQNGMILATGPTGSGKTTTLYTLIKILNSTETAIVSIEDPIEYSVVGVTQIQVNPRTGLTFDAGLRSILRQDPNVIMVGEIRDRETASIAVNCALTGHLLLSTLHTNDAATTLPRLLDMGIEEYLVASTVSIAIGQRLVRKICTKCKEKIKITEGMKKSLIDSPLGTYITDKSIFYKGHGCDTCGHTGYSGRLSINEVLVADDRIREAILRKASARELKKLAIENGMTTMLEDGFRKAESGQTTIEEILRAVHE